MMMRTMSSMPPPPPPVIPVPDVETAQKTAAELIELTDATLARVGALPDAQRHERVDDEWSAVQSIRHLVLVLDLWLSKTVQGETDPFHPIALPPTFMPPKLPGTSIDPDADPTFDEASDVLRQRLGRLGLYVSGLTSAELERGIDAHARTVGGALNVIFTEVGAHNLFINRDLDIIESRG